MPDVAQPQAGFTGWLHRQDPGRRAVYGLLVLLGLVSTIAFAAGTRQGEARSLAIAIPAQLARDSVRLDADRAAIDSLRALDRILMDSIYGQGKRIERTVCVIANHEKSSSTREECALR